jgi:hypothetical protein
MKKIIILLALLALSFGTFSCGGGAGSSDTPSGENPGIPSVIKLLPAQYVAQTNAFIYLHAKVLDGNGAPVKNVPVTFTNLSSIGNLIIASANTSGKVTLSSTVAKTDSRGIATIKLYSTTDGFATVQAEVNTGAGIKRERKTVYFTKYSGPFLPSLILEVVYGELNYYTLFETETDNEVIVQATVYDQFDLLVYGSVVTFGADWPYKIGSATSCSDGSNACEVTFPNGNTATTNRFGEASVLVRVDPLSLKNITSVLNITASADTGAADIVSLLLEPVTIKDVTVSANPDVVKIGDKSTITAAVTLSTGGPAFDGTGVSFTTCDEATCTAPCGAITPFAQTTDGSAGAEYTAPSSPDKCTVTATAGGKSGTKDINVLATLTLGVIPTTQTISDPAVDDTREFKVVGGTAPYYAYSDNPGVVDVALTDSSTVTATVLSVPTADTTVKITIYDSVGANTSASLILDIPPIVELDVNPPTATVVGIANPATHRMM